MNIIQAIEDPKLFAPYMRDERRTWARWRVALAAIYGLPIAHPHHQRAVRTATGRKAATMPAGGFNTALLLTGRRSGKSRIAAIIAAYEAALAGHQAKLAPGERGVVPVIAPTMRQARIVKDYLRALFDVPLLAAELAGETQDGFELRDGTTIEVQSGNFRTSRGFTLLAAVVDEIAFFLHEEAAKLNDTELVRAIKPGLATVGGKLIAITSPYAKRGWVWNTHKRYHANPDGGTLVWQAPSRYMNPTLPQRVVDEALAEDMQAAKSEYLAEFRDDVAGYVDPTVIEAATDHGTPERHPRSHLSYTAFADLSGGRSDDAALAIAHRDGESVVVDYARRWKPPFAPTAIIGEMANELRRYGVGRVVGDHYAGEFVAGGFKSNGINYRPADRNKSELYLEFLPRLASGLVRLPDCPVLAAQLTNLERRTRAGGRDVVDHPPGGHDDLANVVAGVAATAATPRRRVGAM